ncbi:MAG: hypothetical protein JM58_07725 [Peptococcaceae bacterium BICA1-8]|nr:MAG: hypothetical protein JM58_07725 [Peptococcaceae bacterium BICA1-8]
MNTYFKKTITILLMLTFIIGNATVVFATDELRVAKIKELKGEVLVKKIGGEKTFNAFNGMSLVQGDSIITKEGASVIIEVDDETNITIDENTQININELSQDNTKQNKKTNFYLSAGQVWSSIKKKLNSGSDFLIRTPTALMGVRGTEFVVGYNQNGTTTSVLEGTVSVSSMTSFENNNELIQEKQELLLEPNQSVQVKEKIRKNAKPEVKNIDIKNANLFLLEAMKEQDNYKYIYDELNEVIKEKKILKGIEKANNKAIKEANSGNNDNNNSDNGNNGNSSNGDNKSNNGNSSSNSKNNKK